jgi:hypothetical protein
MSLILFMTKQDDAGKLELGDENIRVRTKFD